MLKGLTLTLEVQPSSLSVMVPAMAALVAVGSGVAALDHPTPPRPWAPAAGRCATGGSPWDTNGIVNPATGEKATRGYRYAPFKAKEGTDE